MAQSNNNSVTPLSAEQYAQFFRKFFPVPETMPKGGDQQSDTLSGLRNAISCGFASGTLHPSDLLSLLLTRDGAKELTAAVVAETLQCVMEMEASAVVGAERYQRGGDRVNQRNGYRNTAVSLPTLGQEVEVRVPKLRQGSFYPESLSAVKGLDERAFRSVVAELFVAGVSTRNVGRLTEAMGLKSVTSSEVSALCAPLDQIVERFRKREITGKYPVVFVDATYFNIRVSDGECGTYRPRSLVIAYGVDDTGYRRVLGFDVTVSENGSNWSDFLRSLVQRGLSGVRLLVSDAHKGIREAVKTVLQCPWQRCTVHVARNIMNALQKKKELWPECRKQAQAAFDRGNTLASAQKLWDGLYDFLLSKGEKDAASVVSGAREDAFTFLTFPKSIRTRIRTNNICERVNLELKKRYKSISLFPSEKSALRLCGMLLQLSELEWQSRVCLNPDVMKSLADGAEY